MRRYAGWLGVYGVTLALVAPAIGVAQDQPSSAPDPAPATTSTPTTTAAPAPSTPAAPAAPAPERKPAAKPANQPPTALLYAPNPATVGQTVTFEAYASSDPDGEIARYEWDFDGDGTYESDAAASPTFDHVYDEPGTYAVGLRVTDEDGETAEGDMSLEVQPAPGTAAAPDPDGGSSAPSAGEDGASPDDGTAAPSSDDLGPFPEVIGPHSDQEPDPQATPAKGTATAAAEEEAPVQAAAPAEDTATEDEAATETLDDTPSPPVFARKAATARKTATARAAATTSVTISDFRFSPATVTVNVGDTVRWTNAGPTVHTATASSFDTGNLARGQAGSATFSRAGTFAYICTPHPFMKGTVRVAASGASGSGSGSGSGSSSSSGDSSSTDDAAAAADAAAGGLPSTGADTVLVAAIGLSLLLGGGLLRLLARPAR